MSLRQAKKLTPMSKAVLIKTARERNNGEGQFSALASDGDDDDDNDTPRDSSGDEDRAPNRTKAKN